LGESGIICSADHHQCAECTHAYKATADILTGDDPAGVVGVDENRAIPALAGPDANLAIRDAQTARDRAADQARMGDALMDERPDHAPVRMVVLDGIVMGHQVCLLLLPDSIELTITSNSIVHMMTALSHWSMPEVVYSVTFMKISMVHYAMFGIAIISRLIVHVHVKPTRTYGTSTHFVMVAKHCLVSIAFFDALRLKTSLGFLGTINMYSLMTNNLLLGDQGPTIFSQHEYTVLRQSVHHVG